MSNWLSVKEVAALAEVHIDTARKWVRDGYIKAFQFRENGQVRIRREDYDAFIERSVYLPPTDK